VRLWDLQAMREVEQLVGHAGSVAALDFVNGVLLSGGYDTSIRMWSIAEDPGAAIRSARRAGGAEND
jgi:WD40 repeat protein